VSTAEEQQESVKVSSAECTNSTHEKTATVQFPLKISMPMRQKFRQILEANCATMCEKSVKSHVSSEVTSEVSVSLSSLAVSTEVNSVATKSIAPSAFSCATSTSAAAEMSARKTAVSSHISSPDVDTQVGDTVASVEACGSKVSDTIKEELPLSMDVSTEACNEFTPTAADDEVINTATHNCLDSSHTEQWIASVKCNRVDNVDTVSAPAIEVDATNKVEPCYLNGQGNHLNLGDNHMDVDSCELEDFAPVESKPMFSFALSILTGAKDCCDYHQNTL